MLPPRNLPAPFVAFAVALGAAAVATAAPTLKGRAVWASPRDAGTTEASVVAFVEQLAKAHVNTLIMELKTSAGLFWPSQRFAPAVVAEYGTFDLPAVLIRECHKRADRRSTRGSSTSPRAATPTSRSSTRSGWP